MANNKRHPLEDEDQFTGEEDDVFIEHQSTPTPPPIPARPNPAPARPNPSNPAPARSILTPARPLPTPIQSAPALSHTRPIPTPAIPVQNPLLPTSAVTRSTPPPLTVSQPSVDSTVSAESGAPLRESSVDSSSAAGGGGIRGGTDSSSNGGGVGVHFPPLVAQSRDGTIPATGGSSNSSTEELRLGTFRDEVGVHLLHRNTSSQADDLHLSASRDSIRTYKSMEGDRDRHSARYSGIEVNPLYDSGRRKSSLSKLIRQDTEDRLLNTHKRNRSIRNFVSYPSYGIDEADGTIVTKTEFLQKWRQEPTTIAVPYNTDTEENVVHFLAREGKFDVLRDLCNEHKHEKVLYQALKAKDKFDQTPLLSAFSAAENRIQILNFLLTLVLDKSEDTNLLESTILNRNKHKDSVFTLLMKNHELFLQTRKIFFNIFIEYYAKYQAHSEGFYKIICQILHQNPGDVNSKAISEIIRELFQVSPNFFSEGHYMFSYRNPDTKSNLLVELAKHANDDALRELLVNRHTTKHVTHGVLQNRNSEGQTLLCIIEVNRVSLAESLPIVLKKEYGCHRRDILKTEQCIARQLESSLSAYCIIDELNDLENSNSVSKKLKIWTILFCTWLTPAIGLTFGDIFFDSLLAVEYYHQYNNESFVQYSREKCEECKKDFNSTNFNTSQDTIHCFESCFSSEARLGYTLTFLLLPVIFYLTEFLTLTDKYEVTTLRGSILFSFKEIKLNRRFPLRLIASIFKLIGLLAVTFIVVVFWQPITALFKFYRDGIYETSLGKARVDNRIRKRQSDLTASRGELIEVNVESAFEPIIQGYIIFPNIIDIFGKLGKMFDYQDGKVSISLQFSTVEAAQLLSIGTSMVSLAWCYSEYHSVRKNMLLDITVSPCSRVTMFFYMLMQITARLLAFQLFALYWGPGNLYPLVIFVILHMFVSSIIHIVFSEDLFYMREGKYLKFFHNVFMNSFATIYFHNYLRMDEMPRSHSKSVNIQHVNTVQEDQVFKHDAQTPGLHISTFIRQTTFDILYFIEFVVLLGFGFSSQIVQDGFLGLYTSTFVWTITVLSIVAMLLKFFYYNVLHIWSNTIFTLTRVKSQPFQFMGNSGSYTSSQLQRQSRFVEYVFISSNSWFLGKLKTFKTTILILPRTLLEMIDTQGKQLGMKFTDPMESTGSRIRQIEQWKKMARNLLHWRKTIALLCFFPLIILGIIVPLIIILVLVAAIVLSMPLMVALLFYNLCGNCRNIIDTNVVDNDQFIDTNIEELPPEIGSIENPIFSSDPTLTLRRIQDGLAATEALDLSGKPAMSIEELENITVLLLSLNPRRFTMRELNLNDSRLTDAKLKTLVPLMVRFRTVKIGGKQDYGVKGIQDLRMYMEEAKGVNQADENDEHIPHERLKKDKVILRRLEIKSTKSKMGVTNLTWVNEEVKEIEKEDEKSMIVNEIAHMVPYLSSLTLDGFLRESAVKPVSNMMGLNKEYLLWQRLNVVDHIDILSLRDCDINDRVLMKCLVGFSNVKVLDLSGNHDITATGWKCLADTLNMRREKRRLIHLIFQNYKYAIDDQIGEQLSSMFTAIQRLDLRRCQLSDAAINRFGCMFYYEKDNPSHIVLEKLDLTECIITQEGISKCIEINRIKSCDIVVYKSLDVQEEKSVCCFSCICCCKK